MKQILLVLFLVANLFGQSNCVKPDASGLVNSTSPDVFEKRIQEVNEKVIREGTLTKEQAEISGVIESSENNVRYYTEVAKYFREKLKYVNCMNN